MISVSASGSTKQTESFLEFLQSGAMFSGLSAGGRRGVDALSRNTPRDTGRASESWGYDVTHNNGEHAVEWYNSDIEGGYNVVILIQYGHGTGTGGYVPGRDFINPAMSSVFDSISLDVWRQVTHG
jgi:hypothetical protein